MNKRTHDEVLNSEWISASKTRNSALDDKCLDYFEMYGIYDISNQPKKCSKPNYDETTKYDNKKIVKPVDTNNFCDYILKSGINFEDDIIAKLQSKFDDDFIKIGESYEAIYRKKCAETLGAMIRGVPIIYQGVVHNPTKILEDGDEKTFGAVDLLVRSDWINKIVNNPIISEEEIAIPAPRIKKDYHYRVIDIKWTKLHLNVNKETIRNNPHVKPFKTQLAIYNEALGYMQGFTPDSAYILGNGWISERNRNSNRIVSRSNDPFDRLGKIDFDKFDEAYNRKASDAILWYRKLQNQTNFTHDPPNAEELYPNMNNTMDGKFHHVKEQIADKYHEITQIWNCGFKEREIALDLGVSSWKDKDFSANLIGINAGKKQRTIDAIVQFNRDSKELVSPESIANNYGNWQDKNQLAFYVDFETIQESMIPIPNLCGDFIFLIGVCYVSGKGKCEYTSFLADDISMASEKKVIDNFVNFLAEHAQEKNFIILHWGQHEKVVFTKANQRHGNIWEIPMFVDFCRIMTDEPILVKGSFDFGLKTVAKAMYRNNLISTIWGDEISGGSDAMFLGWKEYRQNNRKPIEKSENMKKIIEYNKIDCRTMYEIITYFKHINMSHKHTDSDDLNTNDVSESKKNKWEGRLRSAKKQEQTPPQKRLKKKISDDAEKSKELLDEIMNDFYDSEPSPKKVDSEDSESSDDSSSDDSSEASSETIRSTSPRSEDDEDEEDLSFVVQDPEDEEDDDEDCENILEELLRQHFETAKNKSVDPAEIEKLKEILMGRMVKVEDIYNLKNITSEQKASLIEKYLKHVTTIDIDDFIKGREDMKKLISQYEKADLGELQKNEDEHKKIDDIFTNPITLEKRILSLDLENKYKKIIFEKYKQLTITSSSSDTYSKLKEWIEHAVKIPYNTIHQMNPDDKPISEYLANVKKVLDEKLFGMETAKEEILMVINNKLRNPNSFRNTIALVGSPGTGKTALIIALCEALNLPYSQISLGGKHDVSYFVGHSYTYEGSRPGKIVSSLQQMGCKNGILFFDEFDKLGVREGKSGVSDLLLHVTDFTQNSQFNDEYIADIPVDLSKVWFIFSLNNIEKVEPILRNRMTFIQVPNYNDVEKKTIVKKYIIPKCLKQFGFNADEIEFSDEVIEYIISNTKKEDGVREIERSILEIFKRSNMLRTIHAVAGSAMKVSFDIPEFQIPMKLTKDHIDKLMIMEEKTNESYSMLYV